MWPGRGSGAVHGSVQESPPVTARESHFPHGFRLLPPSTTALGGKPAFPTFNPNPGARGGCKFLAVADLPCSHGFPEAGRLISFQEPGSRWSEIPSKLPEPVGKGHYVSIAVLHPGQLLRHLFPELFQAAHAEPVWSGLSDFWWRDKIRVSVFIPVFSRRASAEPFDGRGLGLVFEAPMFVLLTRTSRPEMFYFPRGITP